MRAVMLMVPGAAIAAALVAFPRSSAGPGERPRPTPPAERQAPMEGPETPKPDDGVRVLVFSKTAGFRHGSIPDGIRAVRELGAAHGFAVDHTEDAAGFTDAGLAPYDAVVFLSTTGDVLDEAQQGAFERFIRGGGGFAGVHAASDTEYGWPWFGRLVGAYFAGHPQIQEADIVVEDQAHPSTRGLPGRWTRRDEWYNFRTNPREDADIDARILATLDESTYQGGTMGADHPVMWCHAFDGGRSWYTALGHTSESYDEPLFRESLAGGILWAAGAEADEPAPPAPAEPRR